MKKLLSFIMLCLFLLSFIIPTLYLAKAEEKIYMRVIKEDAFLYENEDLTSPLFILPYTYYVLIKGETKSAFKVEIYGENGYPSFFGYTLKENLFSDNFEVVSPYPDITVSTFTSTVMYSDKDCTVKQNYVFPERNLKYFGKIKTIDGENAYLVLYGEKIGYVKEDSLYPFSIPNHPNELTFLTKKTENGKSGILKNADEQPLLKLGIILCLLSAGGVGLYVVLRKKEKPKNSISYYDENDFYG